MILAIDVGATSIKAATFAENGALRAVASRRNGPEPDPAGHPGWMVWNPTSLWGKVCECIQEVLSTSGGADQIRAVACTGFGADGLPLDAAGRELYPFISWHCGRTLAQRQQVSERVGDTEIFCITGYHNYHINTANRLLWFRQNRPDILKETRHWLQVQDYVAYRLSGRFSTECTIASTTMLLDLGKRAWSERMLEAAEVDAAILPEAQEAGTRIGEVTEAAAAATGLKAGTPVVTGGHDCEMAVLGAGAENDATWIDITGTWEILIATVSEFRPQPEHHAAGLDFECHALPGQWICQSLMIAGGVTEWVRANFYRDFSDADVYQTMFREAEGGSSGVYLLPAFMLGMGPDASRHALGTVLGLQTMTSRGQIVRAALEGLCFQLYKQVDAVAGAVGRRPSRLRVVGGGQKSPLWLQLKADITGLPVEITTHPEVTLLGAAMLAGIGGGVYRDIADARGRIKFATDGIEPRVSEHDRYREHFERVYQRIPGALEGVYRDVHGLMQA